MHEVERLEREGWEALSGGDAKGFYERILARGAVMVVPGMVLDRADAIEAMGEAPPWTAFSLEEVRVLEPREDLAIVVYTATAHRHGSGPYTALMTSTYVRHDGTWKLSLHQQTPP